MESLSEIEVFVRVVQTKSFTAAASKLGIGKSAVSKYVSRLEDGLGVRLLNRTTRRLSLTEAGEAFFDRAQRAIAEIEAARMDATRHQAAPSGTLRVTAPMSFGIAMIAPALPLFAKRHPAIVVDLALDDRQRDIIAEGIDIALRITQLADSTLVARRLADVRHVLVAAPSYLRHHAAPTTPDDLREHNCLIYTLRASPEAWRFDGPDGRQWTVPVRGSLHVNNGLALREAAVAGCGIALMTTFTVGDDIRQGRLVRLLPKFSAPKLAAYALYPERRHVPPKVRAFVDFLVERFGNPPAWDRALGFSSKVK